MGSHPYWYSVPYQADIAAALEQLREREFRAGRYNPVIPFPNFPIGATSSAPGPGHSSIDDALEAADADGTRSILDIVGISKRPAPLMASPVPDSRLEAMFGTLKPTRQMAEENETLFGNIARGQAVYVICYESESPVEIFFAGYSCD